MIELSPGGRMVLDSGGLHIMLAGLQQELVEAKAILLTLTFEKADIVAIAVLVQEHRPRPAHGQREHVQAATD